jgi:hypothetical protein
MTTPSIDDIRQTYCAAMTEDPLHEGASAAFDRALAEAQARCLREFIEEADASPAVTWAGPGGVKELAIRRHNRIDSAARAS